MNNDDKGFRDQVKKIPADQAARDIAVNDLSKNLVVEAAAGTGKTTLLVSRLANILINGHARIGEILAITFTEKASVELNERLREVLESILQGRHKDDMFSSLSDDQRTNLDLAIEDLESAQISTIHAFCRSILAERPFEAKLDPGMKTLSEAAGSIYFRKHWQQWLNQQLSKENSQQMLNAGLDKIFELGMQAKKLEDVVCDMQKYRDVLNFYKPGCNENDEPLDVDAEIEALIEKILDNRAELEKLIIRCENPKDDAGYEQITTFLKVVDPLQGIDPKNRDQAYLSVVAPKAKGNQKNWKNKDDCNEQKEICGELQADFSKLHSYITSKYFEVLLGWLTEFIDEFHAQKVKDGVVDFDDLLIGARDLVRDSLAVRADLQNKFKYILVDEFQDTDPLQVELVFYLAQDGPVEVEKWQKAKLKPGKLFLVGDPKQSIYRFRRADIAIYEEAKKKVCDEGGEAIVISQNFRTVPKIVELINSIFTVLIKKGENSDHQPDYVPLDPFVDDEPGSSTYFLVPEIELGDLNANMQRYHEAIAIASSISNLVSTGSKDSSGGSDSLDVDIDNNTKGDARSGGYTYRDIAILFAAQTDIGILEDALIRFNIPYIFESGKQFFERQEITDLRSVVAAIHQPWDELSVFAALRSQFFQVSDDELFMLKQRFGTFDPLKMKYAPGVADNGVNDIGTDADGSIAEDGTDTNKANSDRHDQDIYSIKCIAILQDLHVLSLTQTPQTVLRCLIERTAVTRSKLALGRRERDVANLMKMVDKARLLNNEENFSFKDYAEWLIIQGESNTKEPVVPAGISEIDAVRLMTVHSSKGLEFPVVYLANTTSGDFDGGRSSNELIIDREKEKIGMKFYVRSGGKTGGGIVLQTPNFEKMDSVEKEIISAEFIRRFYVACTRAKKRLYIPLVSSASGKGGFRQRIFDHLGLSSKFVSSGGNAESSTESISSGEHLEPMAQNSPSGDDPDVSSKDTRGSLDIAELQAQVAGFATVEAFKPLEKYEATGVGALRAPTPVAQINEIYQKQLDNISKRSSKINEAYENRIKKVTPSTMHSKDVIKAGKEVLSETDQKAFKGVDNNEAGRSALEYASESEIVQNSDPLHESARMPSAGFTDGHAISGKELGSLFHRMISEIPMSDNKNIDLSLLRHKWGIAEQPSEKDDLIKEKDYLTNSDHSINEDLSNQNDPLKELLSNFLNSELLKMISQADCVLVEVPFVSYSSRAEAVVEGFIDMVIIKDDIINVVDLKTDRVSSDAEINARSDHYEGQVKLYAESLINNLSSSSVRGAEVAIGGLYLYFAYPDRLVSLTSRTA